VPRWLSPGRSETPDLSWKTIHAGRLRTLYPRPLLGRPSGNLASPCYRHRFLFLDSLELARTRRVAATGASDHPSSVGPLGPCRPHNRQPRTVRIMRQRNLGRVIERDLGVRNCQR
jgi:hypothetical protein